ncbi:MAG: glycosyltransferase [Chloroflexota bacterium]|nr:glycosyltransferase [Chloroflexota bacterium]
MKDETILMLANAEWDWSNRVNCHHLAARLARENRVLFVDTVGGRTPAPREFKKIARRLRRIAGGVRKIDDGLTVLSPFVVPIYGRESIRRLNTALLAWQIRRALPKNSKPILWIFLPALVGLVDQFGAKLVIYHCIDEHAANPNVPAQQVRESEERLLKRADAVFASSSTLYDAKRAFNAHTFYLPNVADAEFFAPARDGSATIPTELRNVPHPIAGFIGNISAYKIDLDLLGAVARQKPEWSFVLIGPVGRGDPSTDVSRLRALPNVYLLGERAYAELPRYVCAFDVCLIPFNRNESTRGSLPMKFFEYLAAGKPVVATDLPTLGEFRDLFYPAQDADEFCIALQAALTEDTTRAFARIELSKKYSWDARMKEIDQIVGDLLARKGR